MSAQQCVTLHRKLKIFIQSNIMATTTFYAANTRGYANHGWLDTHHSFSFAGYHDPSRVHFGALRVLNDDTVKGGFGFGKHPHDNMEIITIILDGALEHADSMGHTQTIHTNEVQVMSAGTGIYHSEYNHDKTKDVTLLQIWIFPEAKELKPRYDQRMYDPAGRKNQLQLLVAPMDATEDALKINQQAYIYRTTAEAMQSVQYKLHDAAHGVYVFNISGKAVVSGQLLQDRDAVGIEGAATIDIIAQEQADLVILEVPMAW
jgi:quercetin 2,3-dioxygenase